MGGCARRSRETIRTLDLFRTRRRREIRHINFSLGGLTITPDRLQAVARAIDSGRIRVVLNRRLPEKTEARYSPLGPSVMELRNLQTATNLIGQSYIIHEAVHAVIDMRRAANTTRITGEVAAYLAQTIFLLKANYSGQELATGLRPFCEFAEDGGLVSHPLDRPPFKTPKFTFSQYSFLRNHVHDTPGYSHIGLDEKVHADGVPQAGRRVRLR